MHWSLWAACCTQLLQYLVYPLAQVMSIISTLLKVIQVSLAFISIDWGYAALLSPWAWAMLAVLVAAGQTLNARVYQLLGESGVYYGARFGQRIPWVHAWPYSHMRDPQYIGVLITLAGLSLLLPWQVSP